MTICSIVCTTHLSIPCSHETASAARLVLHPPEGGFCGHAVAMLGVSAAEPVQPPVFKWPTASGSGNGTLPAYTGWGKNSGGQNLVFKILPERKVGKCSRRVTTYFIAHSDGGKYCEFRHVQRCAFHPPPPPWVWLRLEGVRPAVPRPQERSVHAGAPSVAHPAPSRPTAACLRSRARSHRHLAFPMPHDGAGGNPPGSGRWLRALPRLKTAPSAPTQSLPRTFGACDAPPANGPAGGLSSSMSLRSLLRAVTDWAPDPLDSPRSLQSPSESPRAEAEVEAAAALAPPSAGGNPRADSPGRRSFPRPPLSSVSLPSVGPGPRPRDAGRSAAAAAAGAALWEGDAVLLRRGWSDPAMRSPPEAGDPPAPAAAERSEAYRLSQCPRHPPPSRSSGAMSQLLRGQRPANAVAPLDTDRAPDPSGSVEVIPQSPSDASTSPSDASTVVVDGQGCRVDLPSSPQSPEHSLSDPPDGTILRHLSHALQFPVPPDTDAHRLPFGKPTVGAVAVSLVVGVVPVLVCFALWQRLERSCAPPVDGLHYVWWRPAGVALLLAAMGPPTFAMDQVRLLRDGAVR